MPSDDAVKRLEDRQATVLGVVTDAMIKESVFSLADEAISTFGKVHVLCNNAGVLSPGSASLGIWEISDADWDWVMGVNFYGVLYGIQAFVPHMLKHGESGHIVNTASLGALMPGGGTYGAAKHGVLSLTETLYNDLRTRDAAIGASVLCPGFVNTKIFDAERNRPASLAADDDDTPIIGAAQAAQAMLAEGKDPKVVADIVFDAMEQDNLYILPHPSGDGFVRDRVEHVLQRGGPATMVADVLQSRAEGDAL